MAHHGERYRPGTCLERSQLRRMIYEMLAGRLPRMRGDRRAVVFFKLWDEKGHPTLCGALAVLVTVAVNRTTTLSRADSGMQIELNSQD